MYGSLHDLIETGTDLTLCSFLSGRFVLNKLIVQRQDINQFDIGDHFKVSGYDLSISELRSLGEVCFVNSKPFLSKIAKKNILIDYFTESIDPVVVLLYFDFQIFTAFLRTNCDIVFLGTLVGAVPYARLKVSIFLTRIFCFCHNNHPPLDFFIVYA